jgi:hypothetical protein
MDASTVMSDEFLSLLHSEQHCADGDVLSSCSLRFNKQPQIRQMFLFMNLRESQQRGQIA